MSMLGSVQFSDLSLMRRRRAPLGDANIRGEHYDPDVISIASRTPLLPEGWVCTGRYFIREGGQGIWQWQVWMRVILCLNSFLLSSTMLEISIKKANREKWGKRYFVLFSDCLFVCREKVFSSLSFEFFGN